MAGLGPDDVDLAEVHDCFSTAELVHYEDLGFCPKGEGGRFIQEGLSDMGGQVVVNPSGGLLSKGHIIGATGISQIIEIVRQLRGKQENVRWRTPGSPCSTTVVDSSIQIRAVA